MKAKGFTLVEIVVSLGLLALMALLLTGIFLSANSIISNTNVINKKSLDIIKIANNLSLYEDSENVGKYKIEDIGNAKISVKIGSKNIIQNGSIKAVSDSDGIVTYQVFVKD